MKSAKDKDLAKLYNSYAEANNDPMPQPLNPDKSVNHNFSKDLLEWEGRRFCYVRQKREGH